MALRRSTSSGDSSSPETSLALFMLVAIAEQGAFSFETLHAESSAGKTLSRMTPIGSGVMLRASRRWRVARMSGAVVLWSLDAG